MREQRYMTTREFADKFGFNQQTVSDWCSQGRLPCIRINRRWRISPDAIERLKEREHRNDWVNTIANAEQQHSEKQNQTEPDEKEK